MKVGIYFHNYPQEKGGGYAFEHEIFLSLCKLAQDCRHELVFLFESSPTAELFTILTEKHFKIVVFEAKRNPEVFHWVASKISKRQKFSYKPEASNQLRSTLFRENLDFVWFVAHALIPVEEIVVPYIATIWDIQHLLQPWFPEVSQFDIWKVRERFNSIFIRRAAYILVPNIVGQRELSLFYGIPPERFRLLPHPSPWIEKISEEKIISVLEKYQLTRGYLFYPAGFWPHKNHANLLFALNILRDKYGLDKQLVLVGPDKGNLEYLRNLTMTLKLENQVHFLDFVPREDLIALYHGAFALTYMSLFGPENMPPLEAFQCGCPVIVTEYSGAREQMGDAAFYVNGLDPDAVAKSIQELEQQPHLRLALIEKGQQRGASYKGDDYVRDVFKIFDEFESIRRTWGRSFPDEKRNI